MEDNRNARFLVQVETAFGDTIYSSNLFITEDSIEDFFFISTGNY